MASLRKEEVIMNALAELPTDGPSECHGICVMGLRLRILAPA